MLNFFQNTKSIEPYTITDWGGMNVGTLIYKVEIDQWVFVAKNYTVICNAALKEITKKLDELNHA